MRRLKGSNGHPDLDRAGCCLFGGNWPVHQKNNPPAAEKVGSKIIREAENVAAFPRFGRIVPEFSVTRRYERSSLNRIESIDKFDEEGDEAAILPIWHGARGIPQLADDSLDHHCEGEGSILVRDAPNLRPEPLRLHARPLALRLELLNLAARPLKTRFLPRSFPMVYRPGSL